MAEDDEGGDEAAVQPSPPLIAILRRRLRDPGLVPSFERLRSLHVTGGLVRPRWMLRHAADGAAGELSDVPGDDGPDTAATIRYNTLPKRNYIDLRMEQNRMFADEQCRQCRARLAKLTKSSNTNTNNDQQQQQWKKQANAIQSSIDEGLAACPNHEGLRSVEEDFRVWVREKVHGGGRGEGGVARGAARTNTSNPAAAAAGGMQTADNISHRPSHPKKGAEGRAQVAMRDALLERSFLLGDGGHGDDGAAKAANDGNKGEEEPKYPMLPEANDEMKREGNRPRSGSDGDDHSSSSSSRSHRRRRKSKHKRKKHKKRSKRRHDRDEDRRRRKGHRRSRSRSRSDEESSRRSRSRSGSTSSRSSSYGRRRKHRRKEKRRRKHRHRSHREEHLDKNGGDERSLDNGRSLDERGGGNGGNDSSHGV